MKQVFTFNTLKNALLLGFCAVGLTVCRAILKLGLGITGHAMLPTVFFLMIARGAGRYFGAATYTGLLAGCLIAVMGAHRSGVNIIFQMLLTGFIIDLLYLWPFMRTTTLGAILAGALAGSSRALMALIGSLIAGMDFKTAILSVGLAAGWNSLFGALGGALVPLTLKRLTAFGIISQERTK